MLCLLLLGFVSQSWAYRLMYKEQLYRLYHQQLLQGNEDIAENVHWLEQTRRADFANPLNAMARIKDKNEWEKYRSLFDMHINLQLVESYLQWASRFNKQAAYFYNAPWQELNLESLDKAESLMKFALVYWELAVNDAKKTQKHRWIRLEELQLWEDQAFRILSGELNYQAIIEKHLVKLSLVRQEFRSMDNNTYPMVPIPQ